MSEYIPGQRWISNGDPQLGLGIVAEISGRIITVSFPAVGEERAYARDNSPLSRVIYKVGERITTMDELQLTISEVDDLQGLLLYTGTDEFNNEHTITELDLSCFVQLTTPTQRLFSGQFDRNSMYELRVRTLEHIHRLQQSPVRGLLGSRTSLLPHQVYIAGEVSSRHAPRVLLADEVGLGKTIEAGMILHQQVHSGRASRCLIVVPDTLIHQWLVEMLRRFNLVFSIFDQSRVDALREADEGNPFESEQLIICSLDFLCDDPKAQIEAVAAGWDLTVIDEAHHLHWSESAVSPEYHVVEELARHSGGLLLLTATPEQAGIDSHFARLRLLDPDRFHNLQDFKQEEAGFAQLNTIVQQMLSSNTLTTEASAALQQHLGASKEELATADNVEELVYQLLDRYGTGRVLFRNTRATVQNFPERQLLSYPLECPAIYAEHKRGAAGLNPELQLAEPDWLANDSRVIWLQDLLKQLRRQKVLVICANTTTAIALEHHLHMRVGIRSAAFYEGMSIVERDSAAAYFADMDGGAQTLVCSEIGSEGRNFQFAHHMVLFDLPLNPDLLEQRIGRLDRIGQQHPIQIHVPYLQGSAQEILFRWYNEGLNAFTQSCSVGFSIYEHFAERLQQQLELADCAQPDELLEQTASYTEAMRESLLAGREPLLELNSCHPTKAAELIEQIESMEDSATLTEYMETVFDLFGIDHEYHSEHATILRATDHMLTEHFPGLKENGTTVTTNREQALSREDLEFLSWEHPMVSETMEMIHNSEIGNAAVATLSLKGIEPGTLLLETWYTVSCIAPRYLQIDQYLPLSPIRVLTDLKGRNLSAALNHEQLNERRKTIKRATAQNVIKQIRPQVENMLVGAENLAQTQFTDILAQSRQQIKHHVGGEINRLQSLQRVNPAIRNEEIDFAKDQLEASQALLDKASLLLQAVRIIVTT
ncbi:MAG: RNA polymerase-associated protein RapA [Pseudomonadales bacterium]